MLEDSFALVIACNTYEDSKLKQLEAPAIDAKKLASLLADPKIAGYNVKLLINVERKSLFPQIEEFLTNRHIRDSCLLYFACHGYKRPEDGQLYLTTVDTDLKHLITTGFSSKTLTDLLQVCNATGKILVLDCCYSGAISRNFFQRGNMSMDIRDEFRGIGKGTVILTSSNAMQYSFETETNEKKKGAEGLTGIFTSKILAGLESGKADKNGDGLIHCHELFDYVTEQMRAEGFEQTPEIYALKSDLIMALNRNQDFTELALSNNTFLKLLIEENVTEFNRVTKPIKTTGIIEHGYLIDERKFTHRLDFGGETIQNKDLAGVDLHEADICRTILNGSNFNDAKLYWANLGSARAEKTKFMGADLHNAYLSKMDLSQADLSGGNLTKALLLNVILAHTKLSKAILHNSVVVGCKRYDELECGGAEFDDSIIDNRELVGYLRKNNAKNVPNAISTMKEITSKVEEKGYEGQIRKKILECSIFSETSKDNNTKLFDGCTYLKWILHRIGILRNRR